MLFLLSVIYDARLNVIDAKWNFKVESFMSDWNLNTHLY